VRHDGRWTWSFALLGAGSVGNLVDRVWQGSVTDFLSFPHWPAFNFADIFIVTGVLLLVKALFWQVSHPQQGEELWYECEETSWAEGEQAPWPPEDEWGEIKSEPRPEEKEAAAPKLVS
jgi:signal peptidase II